MTDDGRRHRRVDPDAYDRLRRASNNARRAVEAATAFAARDRAAPVTTPRGAVLFERVDLRTDGQTCWLDIRIAGTVDDPHYRIFNPPLLVEDPAGDVVVSGVRYRHDPVVAVATLITRHTAKGPRR